MEKIRAFCKRKNIVFSAKRYFIDAMSAMAQGLFCSLLIGTIIKTLGQQLDLAFLVEMGGFATAMAAPAMAIAIGYALQAPPLVLFSLAAVGQAANTMGGSGGPLAVFFIAIIAAEIGKAISKETKVDILVTPFVTIFVGVCVSYAIAPPIGAAANAFGTAVATRVIKYRTAVIIIAALVIVGAFTGGANNIGKVAELATSNKVTATIAEVETAIEEDEEEKLRFRSALKAAIIFTCAGLTVFGMSWLKLPVSANQSITGAIIGWG